MHVLVSADVRTHLRMYLHTYLVVRATPLSVQET